MEHYSVYLEAETEGRCMAHVLDLPGCMVRGDTRDEALERLPAAIRDTWAWLRRHGEPAPADSEEVFLEVSFEAGGTGPFDPGDTAALFPPEREPISPEEMEVGFRHMSHARADLLVLARCLTEELLDWQPHSGHYTLRRILRHIGNADEWYVSRIVPPETLPPEWADDEEMPLLEFLPMARRTTVERLRQLTADQRTDVFYPAQWTSHPDEPWTARKVLRRALEHEREHTVQVREVLAARRRWLLAQMAASRAGLLTELLGVEERALSDAVVHGDWTVKDILAHIAAWDRWEDRIMRAMVAGSEPDPVALPDCDASNAAFIAAWRDRTLYEVLVELEDARSTWTEWLGNLTEEEFFRPRSYHGEDWTFATSRIELQTQHDLEHTATIAAWKRATGRRRVTGPFEILVAALAAARRELLAAAALLPPQARPVYPLCGEWSLKDVLGHVADWEWVGVQGALLMAAGEPPGVESILDMDAWNATHVEARRKQPWEAVLDDLHASRKALLAAAERVGQTDLSREFPFPWGGWGTPYQWLRVYAEHDRDHARDIRDGAGTE